nr:uncharacterized protein LOC109185905 isoform X2 [Ipomoea batatas]
MAEAEREKNQEEFGGIECLRRRKIKKTPEELMALKEKARVLRKQRELNKAVKGLQTYITDEKYREKYTEYEGIKEAHYVYKVRDRLRKQVLVPLHKALELPEVVYECQTMERAALQAGGLGCNEELPRRSLRSTDNERSLQRADPEEAEVAEVAELQWKRIVDDLAKKGEVDEEPWKGSVITFSADPQLHKVEGETLLKKIAFVGSMECGSENSWETDYEVNTKEIQGEGLSRNVPEVVFWNLRASRSTPVVGNQSGVALVSGFSKNLLTIFLENGGIINPEEVMELAIFWGRV